jgi:hypothetical protein
VSKKHLHTIHCHSEEWPGYAKCRPHANEFFHTVSHTMIVLISGVLKLPLSVVLPPIGAKVELYSQKQEQAVHNYDQKTFLK